MKYIFKGSVNEMHYVVIYYDYYDDEDDNPYLRKGSFPVEWKTIQTNDVIEFPLRKGDYVNVNNERLCVVDTEIHDDGLIVCKTNKIIEMLPNEKEKKDCEDEISNWIKEKGKEKEELLCWSWLKRWL
jgi:hypothetical protein